MSNTQEEDVHSQDLALILSNCIREALQKIKRKRLANKAGNTSLIPIPEPEEKWKSRTTTLVMRETVSFSFPENCDLSHIKDMCLLSSKLKDWVIEKRQRESKICDTSFIHATSSKKFRSIRQIVNHILPEEHSKIPARKRKNKGGQGGTSTALSITPSDIGYNSMINKDHYNNAEMRTNQGQEGTEKYMNEIFFPGNGSKSTKENMNNVEVSKVSMENFPSEPLQDDEIDKILREYKANMLSDKVNENNPEHLVDYVDYDWMFDF